MPAGEGRKPKGQEVVWRTASTVPCLGRGRVWGAAGRSPITSRACVLHCLGQGMQSQLGTKASFLRVPVFGCLT